jgi:hypothetical protein
MNVPRLRNSAGNSENITRLLDLQLKLIPLLCWTNVDDERSTTGVMITEVNPDVSSIFIKVTMQKPIPLEKEQPVFFYDEEGDILFKGLAKKRKGKVAYFKLDENIMFRENRNYPRQYFTDRSTTVTYFTYFQQLESSKEEKSPLLDIGEGGMSFKVPAGQGTNFELGDRVTLTKLNVITFPQEIKGKIVHISPFKEESFSQQKSLKVGVQFDNESRIIGEVMQVLKNK